MDMEKEYIGCFMDSRNEKAFIKISSEPHGLNSEWKPLPFDIAKLMSKGIRERGKGKKKISEMEVCRLIDNIRKGLEDEL